MSIIHTIKSYILQTPFAKISKDTQARILYAKIPPLKSEIGRKTVYCISPYKTGTTYLASCFNPEISQHEPLHHVSLKYFDKNFDGFFAKRMNHLNLKLECCGFLSTYINELSKNAIAKDLEYIWILRPPSSWVTSLINYYHRSISLLHFPFDYVVDLFWKRKIGVDLREFEIGMDTVKNQEIIDKLIKYYFDCTKNTYLLKNVTYIKLKELDDNLPLVEALINETPLIKNRWKRKGKHKPYVYKNQSIDAKYKLLTTKLIEERNSLS